MREPTDGLQAAAWAISRLELRRLSRRHTVLAFSLGLRRAQLDVKKSDLYDARAQEFAARFPYASINSLAAWGDRETREVIVKGIRDGDGVDEVARNLRKALLAHVATVEVIARTEVNRAANWGRLSGWRESGLVREKEFIATLDDRVAPDHLEAHGEVVPLEATFTRGAAAGYLMPPLRANCRCTAAPVTRFTDKGRSQDQVDDDVEAAEEHKRDMQFGRQSQVAAIRGLSKEEDAAARDWRKGWALAVERIVATFQRAQQ